MNLNSLYSINDFINSFEPAVLQIMPYLLALVSALAIYEIGTVILWSVKDRLIGTVDDEQKSFAVQDNDGTLHFFEDNYEIVDNEHRVDMNTNETETLNIETGEWEKD